MNYVGLGNQSFGSMRQPRKVFKPVFEQIANGDHPSESSNPNPTVSYSTFREKVEGDEKNLNAISKTVYLTMLFLSMIMLIISLV